MAALGVIQESARIPLGNRVMVSFQVNGTIGTTQAAEWIATGLSSIDCVVGTAVHGADPDDKALGLQLNARGTGVAAGVNPGDLGITVSEAGTNNPCVTVIGTP